ncbi:MAG: glycine cleavage system protein GcvH [Chitinispirillaceae bacterium]|nr:glycine cleavage system protein GcvH [Chitinispirillaceae bacterium]
MMTTPANLKYSKTHEWVKIEGTNATVGITHHAQEALGDITFVELPKVGADAAKDAACCVIESVKAASDINAPVSGKISAVNAGLETAPESVNKDPFGAGWIFKLSHVTLKEVSELMDAKAYDAFVESEK